MPKFETVKAEFERIDSLVQPGLHAEAAGSR